jgi:hypothetical protein
MLICPVTWPNQSPSSKCCTSLGLTLASYKGLDMKCMGIYGLCYD